MLWVTLNVLGDSRPSRGFCWPEKRQADRATIVVELEGEVAYPLLSVVQSFVITLEVSLYLICDNIQHPRLRSNNNLDFVFPNPTAKKARNAGAMQVSHLNYGVSPSPQIMRHTPGPLSTASPQT